MKTFSIILLILITCMSSFACSCIGKASLEEEYKNVNAVLFGEIVSFEFATIKEEGEMPIPTSDSTYEISKFFTMRIVRYELKIEKVYKGKVKLDTIEIYTGLGGGDCGYPFEVGKKYLVFGLNKSYMDITRKRYDFPKGKEILWTDICMGTTNEYLSELEELEKFTKNL